MCATRSRYGRAAVEEDGVFESIGVQVRALFAGSGSSCHVAGAWMDTKRVVSPGLLFKVCVPCVLVAFVALQSSRTSCASYLFSTTTTTTPPYTSPKTTAGSCQVRQRHKRGVNPHQPREPQLAPRPRQRDHIRKRPRDRLRWPHLLHVVQRHCADAQQGRLL